MSGERLLRVWVRPLAVAAMIACIAAAWAGLLALVLPGWDAAYLPVLAFLAALEAFVSHRLLGERLDRLSPRWRYRAAELFGLYLALHPALNLASGRLNPLAGFPRFDDALLLMYGLVCLCWLAATFTARELDELRASPQHYAGYIPTTERLRGRFFAGGVLLIAGAGLSRVAPASVLDPSRASVGGIVLDALLYFLLGMLMLGQVQYSGLRRIWDEQGTRVSGSLAGRWARYTAVFMALAGLLAFILPTGYGTALLDIAAYALALILALFQAMLALLAYAFAWLLSLLGIGGGPPVELPIAPPPPPPESVRRSGGEGLVGLLRSLLFWLAAVALVVWAVRGVIRGGGLAALRRLAPVRALLGLWAGLTGRLRGVVRGVADRLPRRPARTPAPGAPRRPPFGRRGARSPRERVLALYLDTVRDAAERGVPRGAGETPREYGATLGSRLPPEQRPDVDGLTGAFEEARYSPREVREEHATRARSLRERLRDALRGLGGDGG